MTSHRRKLKAGKPELSLGTKSMLFMLVDSATQKFDKGNAVLMAEMKANLPEAYEMFKQMSYGKLQPGRLVVAPNVITVPGVIGSCGATSSAAIQILESTTNLRAADFDRYGLICSHHTGIASASGERRTQYGQRHGDTSTIVHEVGHNLGLGHSGMYDHPYKDSLDEMGISRLGFAAHFKAIFKFSLYWIDPSRMPALSASGKSALCTTCIPATSPVRLLAFDVAAPPASDRTGKLGLMVPLTPLNVVNYAPPVAALADTDLRRVPMLSVDVRSKVAGMAGGVEVIFQPLSPGHQSWKQAMVKDTRVALKTPLQVGDAYVFAGDTSQPHFPAFTGWYTGPRVVVQPLSTTFPAGYTVDPKAMPVPTHEVKVQTTFLDRSLERADGRGCVAGGGCRATGIDFVAMAGFTEGVAQRSQTRLINVAETSGVASRVFRVSVTTPRFFKVDTCPPPNRGPATATLNVGLFSARSPPVEAGLYGGRLDRWALATGSKASGCTESREELQTVLLPEHSPYYVLLRSPVRKATKVVADVSWPSTVPGPCPAGSISSGGKCVICPKGKSSTAGSNTCECAPGYTGGGCSACPANTYKDVVGTGACTACPPGSSSPVGSTWKGACVCPAGKEPDATTQGTPVPSGCVACPTGTTKAAAGNFMCSAPVGPLWLAANKNAAAPPAFVSLAIGTVQAKIAGCYKLAGTHNNAPLFKRAAVSGSSAMFLAYVARRGGEWAVLPNLATPEARYAFVDSSYTRGLPSGGKLSVYNKRAKLFEPDVRAVLASASTCDPARFTQEAGGELSTAVVVGGAAGSLVVVALIVAAVLLVYRRSKSSAAASSSFTPVRGGGAGPVEVEFPTANATPALATAGVPQENPAFAV